jgi:hypothetical protein
MNDNKFATGQILKKPVEVVKGWILVGWAQKSPEPCWGGRGVCIHFSNTESSCHVCRRQVVSLFPLFVPGRKLFIASRANIVKAGLHGSEAPSPTRVRPRSHHAWMTCVRPPQRRLDGSSPEVHSHLKFGNSVFDSCFFKKKTIFDFLIQLCEE